MSGMRRKAGRLGLAVFGLIWSAGIPTTLAANAGVTSRASPDLDRWGEVAEDAIRLASQGADIRLRRLALIAASHDGGPERENLRHAGADAQAVADVLVELGGVVREDVLLQVDVDQIGFENALSDLQQRAKDARGSGARVEILVYYSGHSDQHGLLLDGQRYPYGALRRAIESLDADVKLAVLDSCLSGSILRQKGGRHRPPFLLDESSSVKGMAVLTSSSANEASQESDELRGSFFTHALVSGLRGAADESKDGRVTLQEAYRFAFDETLARTEVARGGAQHPAYDMRLTGTGDLVLTDLRQVESRLSLGPEIQGRISIRDQEDRLVVEMQKRPGEDVRLGLPLGQYRVRIHEADRVQEGEVALVAGQESRLLPTGLKKIALQDTRLRGGPSASFFPVNISFVSPLELNSFAPSGADNLLGFHFLFGRQRRLFGMDLALGVNFVDEVARGGLLALASNLVMGEMSGAELSLFFNLAGAPSTGLQLAPVGANLALSSWVGAQVGGAGNLALGDVRGTQISPLFNFTPRSVHGAQISLGANLGLGAVRGGALSALANVHDEVAGVQLAFFNLARAVNGTQVGGVNVAAEVSGLQLGIINIGQSSAWPVGLLNLIGDGLHHVGWLGSTMAPLGARLQLGGKVLYSAWTLGIGSRGTDLDAEASLDFSVGGRIPFGNESNFYLDVETGIASLPRSMGTWLQALDQMEPMFSNRLLFGWRLAPWATLSVGPTLHWVLPTQVQSDAWGKLVAGADAPAWLPGMAFYLGM